MKTSELVKEIVADELAADPAIVTLKARFVEDLGADSLDVVELVMRVEEEFEIEISDEDAEPISTVGQAIKYVESKVGVTTDEPRAEKIKTARRQSVDVAPPLEKRTVVLDDSEDAGSFPPENNVDSRRRIPSSVVMRRGQPAFRQALLEIYNGHCAITGYNAVEALEAAHIRPFRGEHTDHSTNGLLLRADIHTLFDLHLISVDTKTMTILLSPELLKTSYRILAGKSLRLPKNEDFHPSKEALEEHRKQMED